jgi:hypothetical protein
VVVSAAVSLLVAGAPACHADGHEEEGDSGAATVGVERPSDESGRDAVADGGGEAAAPGAQTRTCVFPAPMNTPVDTSCPVGCVAIQGSQFDAEAACMRAVLVGCLSCANGCGGAPEAYCIKSLDDGRIVDTASYVLANVPAGSHWATCTQSDSERTSAPRCP